MKILVADDEVGKGNTAPDNLVTRLRDIGYDVTGVATSEEAIKLVQQEKWDLAIVDLRWQTEKEEMGPKGWKIVDAIRDTDENASAQVILYSGFLNKEIENRATGKRVIAIPKMRPGGPPPEYEEHLSSMMTTVRTLEWVMNEPKGETYRKLKDPVKRFFKDSDRKCDDYEKNVFLMTRFRKGNRTLEQIDRLIRDTLEDRGLVGHRADDRTYPSGRNLWDNVCTYIYCCKYGIAVLEDQIENEFNPNVALEYGFMRALDKPTLLLKEKEFEPRADILGTLWEEFDISDLERTIPPAINRWLDDLGIPRRA